MKMQAHDAFRTFDFVAFVNAVFDRIMDADKSFDQVAIEAGLSFPVICNFFRYERVSLPTLIKIAEYAQVHLGDFVIEQD